MLLYFEVLMVVAVPRVIDGLGHLKPAKEEDELEDEEDGDPDVGDVRHLLLREESHGKVGIQGRLNNLNKIFLPT